MKKSGFAVKQEWRILEEWRPIREFDHYEVSNGGRVRNRETGQMLMPSKNRSGLYAQLWKDGVQHARAIHLLVATAFLAKYGDAEALIHIDGDTHNNRHYNLRWTSRSFAYRWTQQVRRKTPMYNRRIIATDTGEIFENSHQAAMILVGLEESIVGVLDEPTMSYMNRHFKTV